MFEVEKTPIKVTDDVEKMKHYAKLRGLWWMLIETECKCNKKTFGYLLIQTPFPLERVIVCKECYKKKRYKRLT